MIAAIVAEIGCVAVTITPCIHLMQLLQKLQRLYACIFEPVPTLDIVRANVYNVSVITTSCNYALSQRIIFCCNRRGDRTCSSRNVAQSNVLYVRLIRRQQNSKTFGIWTKYHKAKCHINPLILQKMRSSVLRIYLKPVCPRRQSVKREK